MRIMIADLDTPIGAVRIAATESGLCSLDYLDRWRAAQQRLRRRFGSIDIHSEPDPHGSVSGLKRYLAGDLGALDRVPVDPGGTAFQQSVWAELRAIRPGRTVSYGELARLLDCPAASRAVGAANGQNPVSIVIPCHRVIGSDGKLCGYGGGLERKRWLLAHEGAL